MKSEAGTISYWHLRAAGNGNRASVYLMMYAKLLLQPSSCRDNEARDVNIIQKLDEFKRRLSMCFAKIEMRCMMWTLRVSKHRMRFNRYLAEADWTSV